MSSTKYCSITAGKNICGICWNKCNFNPANPVKANMQLFACGHGVCALCLLKMRGYKLCDCNKLASHNCQDCELNFCSDCACLHDNTHKDDVFVFENNHENDSYWQGRSWKKIEHEIVPFSCPFCRDSGSSFSTGFGSSRQGKPSNTISEWLHHFCGQSTVRISSLVEGHCTHPYLVMLRGIKKVDDARKLVEAAKLKTAIRTAKYLSLKADMSVAHDQMVKDRKEQEDAKKPKLCESSQLRKPLTPLYTERSRNKTQGGGGKTRGKTGGKTMGNLYKMTIAKERIEKRLVKLRKAERGKEVKDSLHELRRITGKMRKMN